MPSRDKANMSAKEIDELLKRGAYDVFREDDSEQREFEEADEWIGRIERQMNV